MLGFAPTASLAGSGEKLGTDPRIGQRRAVDCVGSPSSREQWACSTLSMTHKKVTTYGDYPQEAYTGRTWTSVESVRGVLVRFSHAICTSIRIAVTLGYE
jgi:hypothetical protein